MMVRLQAVRIYGSKNSYGPSPQGPIVLKNFPGKTERSLIFLGTPPEPVLRAIKVSNAITIVALRGLFDKAPVSEEDMLIKEKLGELPDSPKAADYNWYITAIVEREINADIANREYLWLDREKAMKLEEDFEAYASPYIDILATYVSTIIGRTFFEEVIIDDYVFFLAPNRESFGLPKFSFGISGNIIITKSIESLNLELEELKQLLQKVATLPQNRHQWLKSISHCRLAAIREKDPMKCFLFSFFALEILTNKLVDILYEDVINNLGLKVSGQPNIESVPIPISELVWSKERLPLRAKFAIVALGLFPSSATADVEDFVRAKDARDELSHGVLEKVAELPTSMVTVLLEKYLAGAVKFQLKK